MGSWPIPGRWLAQYFPTGSLTTSVLLGYRISGKGSRAEIDCRAYRPGGNARGVLSKTPGYSPNARTTGSRATHHSQAAGFHRASFRLSCPERSYDAYVHSVLHQDIADSLVGYHGELRGRR